MGQIPPSHSLQLFQGDTGAFTNQTKDLLFPLSRWSALSESPQLAYFLLKSLPSKKIRVLLSKYYNWYELVLMELFYCNWALKSL